MNFERASLLYHQKINQLTPGGSLLDSEVGGSAVEHKIILTTTTEWETPWIRAPFFYLIPSETRYLLKGTQWEVWKPRWQSGRWWRLLGTHELHSDHLLPWCPWLGMLELVTQARLFKKQQQHLLQFSLYTIKSSHLQLYKSEAFSKCIELKPLYNLG